MPRHVDHDRRREEIAAFTLELIRRAGLESASLRRIAKEGGFSMGVLTHYFRSKDEILGFTFHFDACANGWKQASCSTKEDVLCPKLV